METSKEVLAGVFGRIPGIGARNEHIISFPPEPTGNAAFDAWKVLYIQSDEYKQGLVWADPEYPTIDDIHKALISPGAAELAAIKVTVRSLETKHGL